jgi:NAD(P)-dependent dehydrogenase (short-subunit alcohol dehydrogenase family)
VSELGSIDLVVNNHGSFRAFGPIWKCDPDVWWQDVEINLRGTFHTCSVVAPAMLARGKGRIVNLVGGGTGNSFPHGSGYASSKAAIMRFTECLNDTTIGGGVRAFAVDPGLVRTSMTELQLFSDSGKTYLPDIQRLFDEGVNIPPTRAADLIADNRRWAVRPARRPVAARYRRPRIARAGDGRHRQARRACAALQRHRTGQAVDKMGSGTVILRSRRIT